MGGPGCLNYGDGGANQGATDLEDAVIYLDYLESHEVAGEIQDLAVFEHGLTKLYALPDLEADETLQIMTIHKSKGLEFDCVIVPGLGRASRHDDKRLLKWTERPRGRFDGVGAMALLTCYLRRYMKLASIMILFTHGCKDLITTKRILRISDYFMSQQHALKNLCIY